MTHLPGSVQAYFYEVNDAQPDAFLAAFDDNAYVLDHQRAFQGREAIAQWSRADVFDPKVRFEITDALELDGTYVVMASIDGNFDKTNLPDPLVMKHTFTLTDGKIKELNISFL